MLVRDVANLLQDTASDDVANLFSRDFRMNVLKVRGEIDFVS